MPDLGSPLMLFSGYDQKENRATNYSIFLLKKLYGKNPAFLQEVLDEVTSK